MSYTSLCTNSNQLLGAGGQILGEGVTEQGQGGWGQEGLGKGGGPRGWGKGGARGAKGVESIF